jgi:hypothetical protein
MKFYKSKYYVPLFNFDEKFTAIYCHYEYVKFVKNGMYHNTKNAAYIRLYGYKDFSLNDIKYGDNYKFTKQSWRRFCKLQAFL